MWGQGAQLQRGKEVQGCGQVGCDSLVGGASFGGRSKAGGGWGGGGGKGAIFWRPLPAIHPGLLEAKGRGALLLVMLPLIQQGPLDAAPIISLYSLRRTRPCAPLLPFSLPLRLLGP